MRASGWNRIPIIRMTNVSLEPGDWSLDALIADTKDGLYMETNRSWSIDDRRLNIDYMYLPSLAPNAELIKAYRGKRIPWPDFERGFLKLLQERRVEETLDKDIFAGRAVLLCSELTPEKCHRRLVIEYLNAKWGDLQPVHL